MDSRRLKIGGALIGASLAALLAANEMWLPAFRLFDWLLPGERYDDMNLLGLVPYLAALPIAVMATVIAVRRRWPLYMPAVVAALTSALLTLVNGIFLVWARTI